MNNYAEHIDDLIGKAMTKEATAVEWAALDAWLAESDEHQAYYNQMRSLFSKAEGLSNAISFDVDAAWEKVNAATSAQTPVIPLKQPSKTNYILRIAAVVVLALGAGIFILTNQQQQPQFAVAALDEVIHDTLPDGTFASLNKQSSITYEFDKKTKVRKAKLQGEAYFVIAEDKSNQFLVQADELLIKDIGTAFNVKAFADNDTITVYVKEGEVIIYTPEKDGLPVKAGETGYYLKSKKKFFKAVEETGENAAAYADKEFRFRNTPMHKVLREINKVYDVKLALGSREIENCRITVNFSNDDIETIAAVIAETMGWSVRHESNRLLLIGSACQ